MQFEKLKNNSFNTFIKHVIMVFPTGICTSMGFVASQISALVSLAGYYLARLRRNLDYLGGAHL